MRVVGSDDSEGLCLVRQGPCPVNGPVKLHCLLQCLVGFTTVVAMVNSTTCRWAPVVGWGPAAESPTLTPALGCVTPISPTPG